MSLSYLKLLPVRICCSSSSSKCSIKHLIPLHLAEIIYTTAKGNAVVSKNKYVFRKTKIISCLLSYWKIVTPRINTDLVSSNKQTDALEKTEELA